MALLSYVTTARGSVPVPITNPGFENPVQATEGAYTDSIIGWSVVNGGGIGVWNVETADFPAQAPEGANVAYIYSATAIQGFGQVLSDPTGLLQAGASYSLTVKVGNSASYTGFPGYQVQLLAGTTVLAQDDNSSPPGEGLFVTSTVSYTYNPAHSELVGLPLEIRLLSKGLQTGENEMEFDDVKLSATLADPVAKPGGPYAVLSIGSLSLNGSASAPSDGSSISLYEWDLNDDGLFTENVTGVTPAAISYATLTAAPPAGYGMDVGENTIKLRVTDATAKTSINSTTVTLVVASSDADLFDLVTTPVMDLTPAFDSATLNYTVTVPYSTASMRVTPTKWDPGATIKVNDVAVASGTASAPISLNQGVNTITTVVTAQDTTTTKTYTLTVLRSAPSNNANLDYLEPSAGTLAPSFNSGIISYTATVPYATANLTVTPTAADTLATIKVNDVAVTSGTASASIPLSVGANTITTVVTAEDTTTQKTYTLTVTRSAPSNNANLASLEPSAGTLSPPFNSFLVTYTATVPYPTPSMTVTPTVEDATATIKVNDVTVVSGNASGPVSLSVGANTITTVVTAEDGTTTKTYTLTVTREPDTAPPVIAFLSPPDDTAAATTSNFAVAFDEPIAIGTGNVIIRNLTDGPSADVTINITSGSPQVSVAGAVLTINPVADLVVGKNYAIQIDATAIKDLFNNPFVGIADDTTWNFIASPSSYTWTQTAGSARNWTDGVNWSGGLVPDPATGATVDFSTVNIAANTTLTLGGDRTAEVWKFGDTSGTQTWTVNAGNKMILAGTTPTIEVKQNTVTLSNVVDGTQGLTKAGAGTLALANTANTYTGGTALNAGTLSVGANSNLGDSAGGITFSGTGTLATGTSTITMSRPITVNSGVTATISGSSNGGSFTNSGTLTGGSTCTLTIQANNDKRFNFSGGGGFAGTVWLQGQYSSNGSREGLVVNNTALLADVAAPIKMGTLGTANGTIGANGTLVLGTGAAGPLTFDNRWIEMNNWVYLQNTNTTAGNTLTISKPFVVNATTPSTVVLGGVGNNGTNVLAGAISNGSGAGVVSVNVNWHTYPATFGTSSIWALSGNNTYSGGTMIAGGKLIANGTSALGAGNVTVSAGTLQIDAANALADTASLYLPSSSTKNLTMNANDSVAKLFLAGVQQPNGTYTSSGAGSAWMNTGSGILTVGPVAAQPVYWDLNDTASGACLSGDTAAGTWGAANTYWNDADGTGTAAAWTAGRTASFAAGTDAAGAYTVTVDGTQDIGGLTFDEGTVTIAGGTALRMVYDSLAYVAPSLTATVQTPLSQDATARALTKSGTGTLVLAGANTYTGQTTLAAGTLQLTHADAISASSGLVVQGGNAIIDASVGLKSLFFDTTVARTITGTGTLSFAPGGIIRNTDNRIDCTISTAITGAPAVNIKDFGAGNTYLGLKFAPTSGTQTLGAVLNPDNTGTVDKAGLTLAGSTSGNTVASIAYAGGDRYSDTNFQSGGWTVLGNITTGTVKVTGGTHTWNGTVTTDYNQTQITGGTVKGTFMLYSSDKRSASYVSGTGTISPGTSIGTVTIDWGTGGTPAAGIGDYSFSLQNGSTYEWEIGAGNTTDKIHLVEGRLYLQNFTLKVIDRGATPTATDQLPVFTYVTGVTRDLTGFPNLVTNFILPAGWSGTPTLVDNGTGTIYLTGLSKSAGGYATWAATNAPTGGVNDDYDGDGVSNGVEYVLGGTKDTNDLAKLPKASTTPGGDVLFTFVRDQASIDGTTAVAIEVGTTLAAWPETYAVPGTAVTNNPGVTVVKDSPAVGKDTVTLTLPRAPDAKKFARLKVTVP